jgi:ABC-type dipeptide/oligopeptide/nickel transport system permease subunit
MAARYKKDQQVNEFNQSFKPVSLWADAWKRLRRNRMALVSLWVVGLYVLVTLGAPLLTRAGIIYSHTDQNLVHANLPPSLRYSGEVTIEVIEARIAQLEAQIAEHGTEADAAGYSTATGFDFGPVSSEEEASEEGGAEESETEEAAAEEGAVEESPAEELSEADIFALGFADPVQTELDRKKEDLAELREELRTDQVHRRVYILGTDDLGRDMVARIIYGGRISIMIGLVGTLTAVLIGIIVGSVAGYLGGWADNLLMRFVDIMYGLPYMLIVIIIMAMIGEKARGSFVILFVAIALVSWLTIARVVRGQIISLKNSEFVEAARSMGAGTPRIIFRHLLPNTLGVIIVFATLLMPGFILNESFLSYLGLGVSAPDASWGTLVSEGVRGMEVRSWQLLVPAISMTIFLFCMNFLGDGLRDALDPQSKNRA